MACYWERDRCKGQVAGQFEIPRFLPCTGVLPCFKDGEVPRGSRLGIAEKWWGGPSNYSLWARFRTQRLSVIRHIVKLQTEADKLNAQEPEKA